MKSPPRRNQPAGRGYPSLNDQGVTTMASKMKDRKMRSSAWMGKRWEKTFGKRRERQRVRRELHEHPNH